MSLSLLNVVILSVWLAVEIGERITEKLADREVEEWYDD